jgi:hypothetical protein
MFNFFSPKELVYGLGQLTFSRKELGCGKPMAPMPLIHDLTLVNQTETSMKIV